MLKRWELVLYTFNEEMVAQRDSIICWSTKFQTKFWLATETQLLKPIVVKGKRENVLVNVDINVLK